MFLKTPKPTQIEPAQAAELAAAGQLTLVDVREVDERQALAPKVPSVHIPLGTLPARMDELPAGSPVAFLCAAGGRSSVAAQAALGAGLDALNVNGGMSAWRRSGVPTKAG